MSTTLEIAKNFAAHFVSAKYKNHSANHIVMEINSLRCKETQQPVSHEIKVAIVELIEENIEEPKTLKTFQLMRPAILKRLEAASNKAPEKEVKKYFGSYFKLILK